MTMSYLYNIQIWHPFVFNRNYSPARIVARGRSPNATILSRGGGGGGHSCCTTHRDVIFVLSYRTKQSTKGRIMTNIRDFVYILFCQSSTNYNQMFIETVGSEGMVV